VIGPHCMVDAGSAISHAGLTAVRAARGHHQRSARPQQHRPLAQISVEVRTYPPLLCATPPAAIRQPAANRTLLTGCERGHRATRGAPSTCSAAVTRLNATGQGTSAVYIVTSRLLIAVQTRNVCVLAALCLATVT
jgi:hypothetical protein